MMEIRYGCAAIAVSKRDVFAPYEPSASSTPFYDGRYRGAQHTDYDELEHDSALEPVPTSCSRLSGHGDHPDKSCRAEIDFKIEDLGDDCGSCAKLARGSKAFEETDMAVVSVRIWRYRPCVVTNIFLA